jgi:hypothetical protein
MHLRAHTCARTRTEAVHTPGGTRTFRGSLRCSGRARVCARYVRRRGAALRLLAVGKCARGRARVRACEHCQSAGAGRHLLTRTYARTHSRTHARTQWIRATRWAAPVRPARAGGLWPHMSHAARSVSASARSRPRYISSAKRWVADARHASTILRRRMFPCACASPPPSLHPRARVR